MSISGRLTDLYHLAVPVEGSASVVDLDEFQQYLERLDEKGLAEFAFMAGNEVRDLEFGSVDGYINKLLVKLLALEPQWEDANNKCLYQLGIANLHLYYCKRSGYNNPVILETEDQNLPMKSVKTSLNHLREALRMLSILMDEAKGLVLYQTIKALDYAFDVLYNYRVDNGNKPVDLDSSYIYIDQLGIGDNDLWDELEAQMKKAYGLA